MDTANEEAKHAPQDQPTLEVEAATTSDGSTEAPTDELTPTKKDDDDNEKEKEDDESIGIAPSDHPSTEIMNSANPSSLISFVDGPRIDPDDFRESVYHGRAIPVAPRDVVEIPIVIRGPPNSLLEYTIESSHYDISFGVSMLRQSEDGLEGDGNMTVVAEKKRVDSHLSPISGRFLVEQVPCTLLFTFDNTYSFMRSKDVSYRISVIPPSMDDALESRRRRARASLETILRDTKSAESRLTEVITQRNELEKEIESLQNLLMEKNRNKLVAEKEEGWLKKRIELREVQQQMLNVRLESGWEDEVGEV